MIELKNVMKKIDSNIVLNDINVTFPEAKIIGIVGRNGSGKSMLFRMICGFLLPDSGTVIVNQIDLKKTRTFAKDTRALIEKPNFIDNMSGYENLLLLARLLKKIGKNEIEHYLKQFDLYEDKDKKVGKYSLGMKQKLGIIQALMEQPNIIILDEPFSGLDKQSVLALKTILKEEQKGGKTIFISSHIEQDIKELCDVVYEMDSGKLVQL